MARGKARRSLELIEASIEILEEIQPCWDPIGRLRQRKSTLEALIDVKHFDPILSRALEHVLAALETCG
jgi:hypothetical protein